MEAVPGLEGAATGSKAQARRTEAVHGPCDRFIAIVKRSPFLTGTAPADVIPTLGAMLSASGFERLGGSISGPHPQGVEDVLRQAGHPGRLDTVALVRGLEQQTLSARQSAAARMGPDLLVRLLNAVKAPAETLLKLKQPPRGVLPHGGTKRKDYEVNPRLWRRQGQRLRLATLAGRKHGLWKAEQTRQGEAAPARGALSRRRQPGATPP